MQCYPHVFQCDGIDVYILYNGNEFGRAASALRCWRPIERVAK